MKRLPTKVLLGTLFLFWNGTGVLDAQDLLPPNDTAPLVSPEDFMTHPEAPFNGTLEEAYQKEDKLFGTDDNPTGDNPPNINFKFEFIAHVQFQNPGEPSPYIDIQYINTIETPIVLSSEKNSVEVTVNMEPQNWGSLFQNEFIECRLVQSDQQVTGRVTSKLNTQPSESGEEPVSEVILQISFSEPIWERWPVFCSDTSGHSLNTEGAPEDYDMQIIRMINPPLSSLNLPNANMNEMNKLNLSVPLTVIEDPEINSTVSLSGEGSLTLSPL